MFHLTDENFLTYAMRAYDNPHCRGIDEFYEDLNRIKYVKRLLRRYRSVKKLNDLQVRLITNHLIIFYNVFRSDAATQMLFHKLERPLWPALKTCLIFLKFMPPDLHVKVKIDLYIHARVRQI